MSFCCLLFKRYHFNNLLPFTISNLWSSSIECQKQDWPDHKLACKSLKGGTWSTIKLSSLQQYGLYPTLINRLDDLSADNWTTSRPQENTPIQERQGKVFLAKFQIGLSEIAASNVMIYDRQRSFQLFWSRDSNPSLFDDATKMMAGQFKIYRWVRRVGKDEMRVCFDRSPAKNPVW